MVSNLRLPSFLPRFLSFHPPPFPLLTTSKDHAGRVHCIDGGGSGGDGGGGVGGGEGWPRVMVPVRGCELGSLCRVDEEPGLLAFLSQLLAVDPGLRPTAAEALEQPWLLQQLEEAHIYTYTHAHAHAHVQHVCVYVCVYVYLPLPQPLPQPHPQDGRAAKRTRTEARAKAKKAGNTLHVEMFDVMWLKS